MGRVNKYDDDALVSNISLLCSLNRRFHCGKREIQLKSLTKYMKDFKSFSEEEFVNFICRQYVESLRQRKRFCAQSVYNRVSAIQSRMDLIVVTRRRYNYILKNLRKLFNPYNKETDFYTNTGTLISVPQHECTVLRDNARFLMEQNHSSTADRWTLNTYSDDEIDIIYKYFVLNLENYINSTEQNEHDSEKLGHNQISTKHDTLFVELCMLVVFCYHTPRRVSELIGLRLAEIEELIVHNTLNVKSKDGFSVDCIYISVSLADLLNRFVNKLIPNAFSGTRLSPDATPVFTGSYKMYYSRMRKVLKVIIGENRLKNLRLFHGFRNYYANKHLDSKECSRILGHRNQSMTRRYARVQKQTITCEENRKTQVLDYLNAVI